MESRIATAGKDAEIASEQRYVDQVYARLEELRASAQQMIKEGYRQAEAGTHGSLVDRDAMVYQAGLRARSLDLADNGLVFGRLDMADGETLYIGRIGIRTDEHESLVVDWRTPAAEAFYRATPEDSRGVVRRRVLHCRGHKVVDVEDDLLDPAAGDDLTVVGDGAFLASLARTREGAMRDIVATIQREQDEVVRAPADVTVVVHGGPGTGKTVVALHRVAYLLFRHRRRFGARGVLIVGPNPRFTSYIDRVLPALGEGDATLRSLGDLRDTEATTHDAPDVAAAKGSGAMTRVLRRAVRDHPPDAPDELCVTHHAVVVRLDRPELDRIRLDVHRHRPGAVNTARPRVTEALLDALWERFVAIGGADELPGTDRSIFGYDIRGGRSFTDFLDAWWPIRRPSDVLAALGDAERLRRAAEDDLTEGQVASLAASWEHPEPSYADVALLDEIDLILGPPPRGPRRPEATEDPYVVDGINIITGEEVDSEERPLMRELTSYVERRERAARRDDVDDDPWDEYAHIVLDEAQDLSAMQWRMLGRRGRATTTWTVVDDPAQSATDDRDDARRAREAALGRRTRHTYELTTNYRNSVEVAEVAARVLRMVAPDAEPARAVRTSGHSPVVRLVSDVGTAVREETERLLDQVEGIIGVILPVESCIEPPADLPPRAQVLDALEAKGLEFDATLIVSPETISARGGPGAPTPGGLRTLYVALSRATRRLTVLTADPWWHETLSP